jgi:hypothetical protein
MRPSLTSPLLILALLAGASSAGALQSAPTVKPLKPTVRPAAQGTAGVPNLPPAAGGKALVEAPSFDAGKIERGGKITHSFIVKNTGTGELALHAKPG